MLTTDPNDTALKKIRSDGQQESYLVLSEEERAKGFVRPVRYKYRHLKCGTMTSMGDALSETYARDPNFYSGTFCCDCGTHFRLRTFEKVPCSRCNGRKYLGHSAPGQHGYIGTPECPDCNGTGVQSSNDAIIKDEFKWQFEWWPDGDPVGSNAEEAEQYIKGKRNV